MTLVAVALLLAAGVLQAGAVQPLAGVALAAPVLPVALLVAWAIVRDPDETWVAILLPALVLGALSEERVAWFIVAMLPAPALVALLRSRERTRPGWRRRATLAASAAAVCAFVYAVVLAVAGGATGDLVRFAPGVVGAAFITAVLAALAATALSPLRPREQGLFA